MVLLGVSGANVDIPPVSNFFILAICRMKFIVLQYFCARIA